MLLARSRHASVPSLERYAPGVDAVARHVAQRDPAARRKRERRRLKIITLPGMSVRHSATHRMGAGLDAPRVALTQIVN
ncbi:hypothetical protein [Streptomyces cellulosae]|uniref:Integrase n=1 Tax=Streptomyces cellulosae TaxID=1968 RepID=A0ABW7Y9N9_STRCE